MTKREPRILIVDDDPAVLRILELLLRQADYAVEACDSAEHALSVVGRRNVDLVLADVRMPGMDGIQLLRKLAQVRPDLPVVMITAHGSVEVAVQAMKLGAADFMMKPLDREEIVFVVNKVLRAEAQQERPPDPPPAATSDFVGESAAMSEVFELIGRAARTDSTVLIRGETGTGKELVARAIHDRSPRSTAPFVKVHCAGLPDSLLESELFGHEKGAFTGATSRKPGRIELANGGTVFLDEIGDVSLTTQIKLLRVVQDLEFERVGGTRTLRADVRFLAATHRDLESMIGDGEFREDFFYRLNVIPIWSPPLRERRDDIPRLARHFCDRYGSTNGRQVQLTEDGMGRLVAEEWPGNVRQLQNVIERLVVLSDADRIGASEVERELARSSRPSTPTPDPRDETQTLEQRRQKAEKDAIVEALARSGGNRSQAARLLGISRRTLYNKLEEFDLD
jgi:DNA-binding NtrC family response regulator